ncbi:MAG TPA: tetratricopeptide repeat protein [Hypericibacter adhaerens]|jgi:tetratricopeptide (TPR) repeat protein|uniref:Uncharacterized protein n=1 Tax=Hypericibacter adhaerens TaxID=2602016 RepID=A0A5J6MUY3_9PROT|nr:tetratricopeptide repeat protein [Hypericibacter adhaerens]QEX21239.1 hypothetical protein FRZ61_11620 [Hypericibacter adhaerens]HWA44900.1 tetratricopeptide repeat protein [Hypericibacter adhaerens]
MSQQKPAASRSAAALSAYLKGDHASAERLYREALALDAKDAAALHGLGVLRFQQGRKPEAIELLGAAARLTPGLAEVRRNHAAALASAGRFAEAAGEYRAALAIEPSVGGDWSRLGSVLGELGQDAEAIAAYETALSHLAAAPASERAGLLRRLGTLQRRAGQVDAAIRSWRESLALLPDQSAIAFNLGNALKDEGRSEDAEAAYRRALAIEPGFTRARINLGAVLHAARRLEDAEAVFREALAHDPGSADARRNLAVVLHDRGRDEEGWQALQPLLEGRPDTAETLDVAVVLLQALHRPAEALAIADRLLALDPRSGRALGNRASALLALDRIEEARDAARIAAALPDADGDVLTGAGVVFRSLGLMDQSIACFRRALAAEPGHIGAHSSLAMALLMTGQYEEGWAQYEWRWKTPDFVAGIGRYEHKRWNGEPRPDATLLVYAEQGFGDSLQFARLIAGAAGRVGRIAFEIQPELARLMQGLAGTDEIVPRTGKTAPFDLQVPLLSLPTLLGVTLDRIPGTVPYLHAEPERVRHWADRLRDLKRPRIGLVWQGNPRHPNDRLRSIALARLAPLIERREAGWVSLQKGPAAVQIEAAGLAQRIFDPTEELADYADTAAVCANLDLVISVDTSVAHLAGALGRPLFVLLPLVPDFRWLLGRRDSPWYPTARLFRQIRYNDWSDPLAELDRAIAERVRDSR